jgi:hypothetical protein
MSQPRDSPSPDGAPVTPDPPTREPRSLPPDGPMSDKDEPGDGTSPDPRMPYGPNKGPPVGEDVGEDSETKPPSP